MKKPLLLLIATLLFIGCKKDEDLFRLNATTYLDDEKVYSNIAFLKSDQADVLKDAETVDEFFKGRLELGAKYTTQYKEYVKPGEYIVLVQIADVSKPNKIKTYSYKHVAVANGMTSNVMVFSSKDKELYQPWVDKYPNE